MAKKSANPADAYRKAQRAKELKKNKEERKKVRDSQAVKKDTRELESEIRQLKSDGKLNANAKARLADLEMELAKINKVKEAYVAEHPEARDRVFHTRERAPRKEQEEEKNELYDDNGRLRDPTRSVYFDPVYNPFGVPPPGMPYKERTPEVESESEDEESGSDDDIVLPGGPPPGQESDSDDSDDIPLPAGPPPPKPGTVAPLPTAPPQPIPFAGPPISMGFGQPPPFAPLEPFPVPDTDFPMPSRPAPSRNRPPPTVQDPLSDAPTQTYQGYRMAKHDLPSRPGPSGASISSAPQLNTATLLPKPETAQGSGQGSGSGAGAGTISAAPVMRDLRKEATAFVPRGVKRKKQVGGVTVNAAPGSGVVDEDGDEVRTTREEGGGLMGKLKGVLGPEPTTTSAGPPAGGKSGVDDAYAKFLEGLGDLS